MDNSISKFNDVIDTRDIIERFEALSEDENRTDAELEMLATVVGELEQYCDNFRHGETLIRYDYFKTYARDLAEDIGAIDANATWPNTCIDWDQACRELKMDYQEIEFDGITYYYR